MPEHRYREAVFAVEKSSKNWLVADGRAHTEAIGGVTIQRDSRNIGKLARSSHMNGPRIIPK